MTTTSWGFNYMAIRSYKPNHAGAGRRFNPNKDRDNLYDREWEKYRLHFLNQNPRCYACGVSATVVDHLIPHKGDEDLFKKLDNHIPLCKSCHDKATALFDKKYRPGQPIKSKLEWLAWSRASRELTFRVKVMPSYVEVK